MALKVAIFDLDGTLVDTRKEHMHSVVGKTLHELGVTSSAYIGSYEIFANKFWKGFTNRDEMIRSLGLDENLFLGSIYKT